MISEPNIAVIDCGSQYTTLISTRLRECGVRSESVPYHKAASALAARRFEGVILSGGEDSIKDAGARVPGPELLELLSGTPILGICLGLHYLVKHLGGEMRFDPAFAQFGNLSARCAGSPVFQRLAEPVQDVWESHNDSVKKMPPGFSLVATGTERGDIQAIWDKKRRIIGVQFHPEVLETRNGAAMLAAFVFDVCGCEKDWFPADAIGEIREEARKGIGDEKAVMGYSGGVDSSVAAAILAPVLGLRLFPYVIEMGQLREGEVEEALLHGTCCGISSAVITEPGRLMEALKRPPAGLELSEAKRQCFTRAYADILTEQARRSNASVVIQASLRADFIESGREGLSALIKSHHNVGAEKIFEKAGLRSFHPLRQFFKQEVRALARALRLSDSIVCRAPFPGPGNLIRFVGGIPIAEELALIRWAYQRTQQTLRATGDLPRIAQLVVAIPALRVTGVKGDGRSYGYPVFIRVVESEDFMTAAGYRLPQSSQEALERALTAHPDITAVSYWPTSKPPQTVEFE